MSNNLKNPFYQNDLEIYPVALVLKRDLHMVKIYHHTKNKVFMSRHSKVIAGTDKKTDSTKTLNIGPRSSSFVDVCCSLNFHLQNFSSKVQKFADTSMSKGISLRLSFWDEIAKIYLSNAVSPLLTLKWMRTELDLSRIPEMSTKSET